ncbi:BatD family protein [Carboxylicivirga caseinilyticus]|uniref:BatD family protein n=1 Tax=Carboxylicivirga caseinilyticus TaxID=3417572 RepID=UPI003D33CA92|nr:protein BatD [Marinilabiliaceae bacterium A049]
MRIIFLLTLLIAGISKPLYAQNAEFTARAPQAVVAGDKFQLVYTLNKEGSDIRLGNTDNFQILMGPSTSYSQSTSIINGKVTRETTYSFTYVLKAEKEGSFTIPSATILVDGKKVSSNAVDIEVIKSGTTNPQQGQQNDNVPASAASEDELFITVTPSKSSVYQNESLVLTTKIYTKVNLDGLSDIKQPNMSSFITQELKQPDGIKWTMQNINGRTYNVGTYEQKLLFPQKSGKITIEPTEIEFLVRQRVARQSRSIFDDFFESNYRSVKKKVKSKPVTIDVKPLPAGRPEGFSGGVGKLSMNTSVTKTEAEINDGITLKVTVSGTGNHKFIENPEIKFPADFDDFDPKISNSGITTSIAGMKGSKTYEYLLIPRHAGTFTIPSIKFSYFDPSSGTYKSSNSKEITITVAKGEGGETGNSTVVRSTITKENVKFIGKDIRFIKTGDSNLKPIGTFIIGSLSFYSLLLAPLFLFILLFIIYQKRIKENANIQLTKTKRANKVAKKRLKQSAHFLKTGEKEAFYEELLRALWGYMSDKLSIPLSSLSKDNISDELGKSSVESGLISEIIDIMDTCEFARYAPASGTSEMDKLYQKTIDTISKLENQIKRK